MTSRGKPVFVTVTLSRIGSPTRGEGGETRKLRLTRPRLGLLDLGIDRVRNIKAKQVVGK